MSGVYVRRLPSTSYSMMGWVSRSYTPGANASWSSSSLSSSDSVSWAPDGVGSGTRLLNEPNVVSIFRCLVGFYPRSKVMIPTDFRDSHRRGIQRYRPAFPLVCGRKKSAARAALSLQVIFFESLCGFPLGNDSSFLAARHTLSVAAQRPSATGTTRPVFAGISLNARCAQAMGHDGIPRLRCRLIGRISAPSG